MKNTAIKQILTMLASTALWFIVSPVLAEEMNIDDAFSNWEDEPAEVWNVSGFSEVYAGAFFNENRTNNDESIFELRNELAVNRYMGSHFFSSRLQLVADKLEDPNVYLDVRELFINFNLSQQFALRVGQQVTTWGTGDMLFINDMFPKDWQSMFAGRDDGYLKSPSASLKLSFFSSWMNADFVWVPIFTADNYIKGERFVYFNPSVMQQEMMGQAVKTMPKLDTKNPKKELKNGQFHLRLSHNFGSTEAAIYAYQGFYTQPMGYDPVKQQYIFPTLQTAGTSLREDTFLGLLSGEIAYWHSADDTKGDNNFIPNSQFKSLVGIEKELFKNFTAGVQWMREQTLNYDEAKAAYQGITPIYDEVKHTYTLRLRLQSFKQKVIWSLFSYYSPTDKDGFSTFKVTYRYSDNWLITTGANLFSGEKAHTQWGQFEPNSNYFAQLKYNF